MRQRPLTKTKTWVAITLVLLGAVLVFAVRKERASAGEFFTARNFQAQVENAQASVAAAQARIQSADAETKTQAANFDSAKPQAMRAASRVVST